ncbi:MAG: hypothetical protein ACYTKD_28040 [Planctomycetota bacterium]|jgi:hypothetical protein
MRTFLPGGRWSSVLAALLWLIPLGCHTDSLTDEYETRPRPEWQRRFGYFSVGLARADFFGDVKGVDGGTGVTVYAPPMIPVSFAAVAGAVVTGIVGGAVEARIRDELSEEGFEVDPDPELTSGFMESTLHDIGNTMLTTEGMKSGVSDSRRRYVSDFSVDLSVSHTVHNDLAYGGDLEFTSWLLGVRLAGPRRYRPRYYACGGVGWHSLDCDLRPDADVFGPYAGGGLELFVSENTALGLEYRAVFFFGEDGDGIPVLPPEERKLPPPDNGPLRTGEPRSRRQTSLTDLP